MRAHPTAIVQAHMSFFEKLTKEKGAYIFLSHSHNDIKKVREIRNRLEVNGFEPLCFS